MADKYLGHTVSDTYGHQPLTDPDRFGIEIEMEGVPEQGINFPNVGGWVPHPDGSLRNGIEFVSNGPRTLAEVDGDLTALATMFASINFVPVFSYRTSLHVHVNVRDLTWVQLVNLWTIYTVFEPVLLEMGGEERVGNVHCQSTADCTASVDRLIRCFDDRMHPEDVARGRVFDFNRRLQTLTSRDRRYASFNFAALPNFGTIEFRSHRGTMDHKTTMSWVQTLNSMKQAARGIAGDDPQELVSIISQLGLEGFAAEVFGPGHFVTNNVMKFERDCWDGIRLAQDVAFCRPDWLKAKKPAKKKKPVLEEAPVGEVPIRRPRGFTLNQAVLEAAQLGVQRAQPIDEPIRVNWAQFARPAVLGDPIEAPRRPAVDWTQMHDDLMTLDQARQAARRQRQQMPPPPAPEAFDDAGDFLVMDDFDDMDDDI